MKTTHEDVLALEALAFAFSGKRAMPRGQHREVGAALREAKAESRESRGKRKSRFFGFGPVWARGAAS